MQAGIISEENLAQILRGLSQKRRHGILEVHAGDRILEVAFFQGKIVDVIERKIPLVRRMALRLARRGMLTGGEWISTLENRQQLVAHIEQQGEKISPELIQLVQEQQALDDLYSLELVEGSYYHFRVEMVNTPAEHDLQLSVGQLLLDLVAIKENRQPFSKRFPDSLLLTRVAEIDGDAGLEARDLYTLVDSDCSVSNLRQHSLLGQLVFEETLTHLVDTGVLRGGAAERPTPLQFDLSALDASIDEYAADVCRAIAIDSVDQSLEVPLVGGSVAGAADAESSVAHHGTSPFSTLSDLNRKLLDNPQVPEVVLAILLVAIIVLPLWLW